MLQIPIKSFLNIMCIAPFVMIFCLEGETDTSGFGAWDSIRTLQPLLLGFPVQGKAFITSHARSPTGTLVIFFCL